MLPPDALFDRTSVPEALRPLLDVEGVHEILARLDLFVAALADDRRGRIHPSAVVTGAVVLHEEAEIGPHALVEGPAWIGPGASVGHGAYLRGGVVLASDVRVGHASEVKRSLLLRGAKLPHFNYVGDSVVGADANLGAGVKIANFNAFGNEVEVAGTGARLRKFGAAVGDGASIGCNAVLAPGTVLGPRAVVYNGAMVRGRVDADVIVKNRPSLEQAVRRDG